jgi:hypothetical protein
LARKPGRRCRCRPALARFQERTGRHDCLISIRRAPLHSLSKIAEQPFLASQNEHGSTRSFKTDSCSAGAYMRVPRRRTTAAPRGRLTITAPRAPPSLRLTTMVLRRPRTIVAVRGRRTITAPRAPGVRLTIIAPRRPRTAVTLRGRLTIMAPRAPRVRLTTAVLRRPRTIVARGVRVATASPRGPLAMVRRAAALASSGAATVATPKNAEMPSAASTGTDKRIVASLLWGSRDQAAFGDLVSQAGAAITSELSRICCELLSKTFRASLLF